MLDPITVGVLGLAVLFVLLILRMPVGIAMIVVGIGGTWVLSLFVPFVRFVPYIRQFKSLLWENVANYDLSVVPLFVLMGYIAAEARLCVGLQHPNVVAVSDWGEEIGEGEEVIVVDMDGLTLKVFRAEDSTPPQDDSAPEEPGPGEREG